MKKILLAAITLVGLNTYAQDTIKPYFLNSGEIINAGIKLYDEGKYLEAITEFDKIHRYDTNFTWACYEKTLALASAEKYQEAVTLGEFNISNGYKEAQQYSVVGAAYDELGQYEKALAVYDRGLAIFPVRNELLFNRAVVFEKSKKYGEALNGLKESLRINPFNLSSHARLGKLCAKQGLYTQALLSYVTYLIIEPSGERSLNTLTTADQIAGMSWKELNTIEKSFPQEFKDIDFMFSNRIALNEKYQTPSSLEYPIIKQLYAAFEQMRNNKNFGEGYWATFYGPFYKEIIKTVNFSDLSLLILASVEDNEVQRPLNKRLTEVKELREKLVERWYKLHDKVSLQRDGKTWDAIISMDYQSNTIDAFVTLDATGKQTGYQEVYYTSGGMEGKGPALNDNKEGNWTFSYESGEKLSEFAFKEGKRDGPFRIWYPNGELKEEGTMVDDVLNGKWRSFYPSGVLENEETYSNGKQEGQGKRYFKTGELEFEYTMSGNKLNGRMKEYYSTGQLYSEVDYTEGEKNGVERKYFVDGTLSLEQYYNKDVIEGQLTSYYSNGKIESEGNTAEDNAVGVWKYYHPNGKLKMERNIDEEGKDHGPWLEYGTDGKLYKTYDFNHGELKSTMFQDKTGKVVYQAKIARPGVAVEEYNEYGVKTAEGTMSPTSREGKWTTYNDYGTLLKTIPFEDGQENGEVVEYFTDGKVQTNTNYKNGELDGFYKDRFLNGNTYYTGNFVEGKKWMEWKAYNNNGTIANLSWYENDKESHCEQFNDINGRTRLKEYYDEYDMIEALVYFDSTGKALDSVRFVNGNGDFELKGYGGTVYQKGTYKSGQRHGIFRWYYPNGQIETEGQYQANRRKELWSWYHPNGELSNRGAFVYGQKTGKWEAFDAFGVKRSESIYAFDKLNGTAISFNGPVGEPDSEKQYTDGKLQGSSEILDPSGKSMLTLHWDGGILIGYSQSGEDNKAGKMIEIKNGTAEISVKYVNGQPALNCKYVSGELQGAYETFYQDGKPWSKYTYQDGQLSGPQSVYYPSGVLATQWNSTFDRLNGHFVWNHPNGKVREEGEYYLDHKNGAYRYFDLNGKPKGAYQFYDDQMVKELK